MNPKIQSITFDGLPPSVNTIYRNVKGRGRVKSERYRKWINSVNWQLNAQAPQKIDGEVEVSIYCKRPDKRRRDIDNCIKAVLDMLVSNHLIEDDSRVVKVSAEWCKNPDLDGTMVIFEARV